MKTGSDIAIEGFLSDIEIMEEEISTEPPPESSYQEWLAACVPRLIHYPNAEHHDEFWRWAWGLRESPSRPRPYLFIVGRDGGKTSSIEAAVIMLGCLGLKNYIVIVRGTEKLAKQSMASIKKILESEEIAKHYPKMSTRAMDKYNRQKGYRSDYAQTAGGVVIQCVSISSTFRGAKEGEHKPDCMIFDDIDEFTDTLYITENKEDLIKKTFIKACSKNRCIIIGQNLINNTGVVYRLWKKLSGFLLNVIVNGPTPAIRNLKWDMIDEVDDEGLSYKRPVIAGGEATWVGSSIADCQDKVDDSGIQDFLSEDQHQVEPLRGKMFNRDGFKKIDSLPLSNKIRYVRYIDKGATRKKPRNNPSFTSMVLCAMIRHGKAHDSSSFYFIDEVRGQWDTVERERMIRETVELDAAKYGRVHTVIEVEPSAGGKDSAFYTVASLAEYHASGDRVNTGKELRAEPLADQCAIGNVYILDLPFADGFITRMVQFPRLTDTGDAASGAYRALTSGGVSTNKW